MAYPGKHPSTPVDAFAQHAFPTTADLNLRASTHPNLGNSHNVTRDDVDTRMHEDTDQSYELDNPEDISSESDSSAMSGATSIAAAKSTFRWALDNMIDANHLRYSRGQRREINSVQFSASTLFRTFSADHRRTHTINQRHNAELLRGQLLVEWTQVMGAGIARHCVPSKLEGRVLTIVCSSPIWASEILLQQRRILKRLNRVLTARGKNALIARLYCVTGTMPTPDSSENKPPLYPKETQLDAPTNARIEETAEQIRDEAFRDRFARVMRQVELNRRTAIRNGAKVCPHCGNLNWGGPCATCERERNDIQEHEIYRVLAAMPWLTAQTIEPQLKHLPLDLDLFLRVKKELSLRLRSNAWSIMRSLAPGDPLPPRLRTLLVELASMVTQTPVEQMTEQHIKAGLRPMLAKAYLTDKACQSNW